MEELKNLERVVCKELEKLDSEYANKNEFTDADAKKFDLLAHAWKSYLTAKAMHKAESINEMEGQSYARGRSPYSGRYVSREGPGYSGHYPPPWYPERSYGYDPIGMRY